MREVVKLFKYLFLGIKVAGRNLFCVLVCVPPLALLCDLFPLWAGDGVVRGCAIPLEDVVERVLCVVGRAGVVRFLPVDVV